ncbi:MAG: hypothetical protein HY784_07940, partial [Chloroflexi bacterium]|nr:hypothetical protein [Chloroflexota bacterium]
SPARTPVPGQATPASTPGSGSPTSAASPAPTLPPSLAAVMDQIQNQVEGERDLQAGEAVHREMITRAELGEKLKADSEKNYTQAEAQDDVRSLAVFGLTPPDFDLYGFLLEVQTEGILGFYDPEVKTMYVIAEGQFGGFERLTYAHEYTHVLQDQAFRFSSLRLEPEDCLHDSERCAAIQALYEGDATAAQLDWLVHFATSQDRSEIQRAIAGFETPVLESGPAFYSKQIDFTYSAGLDFVQHLRDQGGWAAVDAAYGNPPLSTEQILHPEKYPGDRPLPVASIVLTDTLGGGWRQVDAGAMGELYLGLILEEQLSEGDARAAATGWGGDAYTVSYNQSTDQTAMALHTVWDTPQDARKFDQAFGRYNRGRFGGGPVPVGGATCYRGEALSCSLISGAETLWVLGPDEATVSRLLALFPTVAGGGRGKAGRGSRPGSDANPRRGPIPQRRAGDVEGLDRSGV